LGEHYLDRVGVSGSSPLQIITKSPCAARALLVFTALLFLTILSIDAKLTQKKADNLCYLA
ncbi:hypothetical protein ACQKI4_27240, partial [Paenibacillus glucanolyticus]|uniref:hypothetical protein n=1 Tax=Paenibacillus glucanolyticus TaxID=59843 RepID=UPI003D0782EC